MLPVELEEKIHHYKLENLSKDVKERFCKLYLMYTHQVQLKLAILQQEFFIFEKIDKKVDYIEKIFQKNPEIPLKWLGYEKLSIFYELFAEKKLS